MKQIRSPGAPRGSPIIALLILVVLLLSALPIVVRGALLPGGGFDPLWSSADGGGGMFSTGSDYSLGGTTGQHDAGTHTDGNYTVHGGFWGVGINTPNPTLTPTLTRTFTPTSTFTLTPTITPTHPPTHTPTPLGGIFDPLWHTVDGGGGMFSTEGDYSIGGTAGQHDAGVMTDGTYTIEGGFWGVGIGTPNPTLTPTNTQSSTPTNTFTDTPTITLTPTATPTNTPTPLGGTFDPLWYSVDGGGAMFSDDGNYSLGGTASQHDAGTHTDGNYTLDGGFWSATLVSPTPTPTNTATPTNTPTVASMLVGHVTWQGPPVQPHVRQQLPVTLTLKLGSTEVNYPSQNTDSSGFLTVSVAGLANGTYDWRAKGPKYIANSGTIALAGMPQANVEMGLMRAGDCNNDNLVSIADFNILKSTFGLSLGNPGYDDRADFSNDDVVSITDFNLQKSNFGVGGSPPVRPGAP